MPPLLHRQAEAGRHRWSGRAVRAPVRPAGQEVALSGGQLEQLRATKLRALAQDKVDVSRAAPSALPGGAALLTGSGAGPRAWILIDDGAVARFGPALAWAIRQVPSPASAGLMVDVVVDGSPSAPGIVARRAAAFSLPISVWGVSGRSLVAAAPAPPVPADADGPPPAELVGVLSAHGLEVVWEHGVLRGEVLGLEVARTVGDHLEVGVGRHDRSARFEMRPNESLDAALDEAVFAVRALRRPGAPVHPANTLARSRWLRSVAVSSPASFGFSSLVPVAPPLPWFDLPEAGAAPCVGTLASGSPVVAVFSVGVDLDLIPTAADGFLLYGSAGASLCVVVPEGDDLPVTRSLAALVSPRSTVLTVPRGWASSI